MADLSQVKSRQTATDRKTNRRSGILPERRDTRQPDLEINANMRSAARGDGGADEIRRIFGMANDAFQQYARQETARKDQENADQGQLDGLEGRVDEARFKRSESYRNALSDGRVQRSWAENSPKIKVGLDELLKTLDDPDPEVRERAIDEYIENSFGAVAIDPETGKPFEHLTTKSKLWLAQQMKGTREGLRAAAVAKMEEQMDDESIENASAALVGQLENEAPDVETLFADVVSHTADKKKAKEAFIATFQEWALSHSDTQEGRDKVRRVKEKFLGLVREGLPEDEKDASGDPLAPLADGEAPVGEPQKPTGRLPFAGKITNDAAQHRARGSAGIDIDGAIGDPIEAPAGGEVIKVDAKGEGKSGKFVIIKHADGSTSSYSHLDGFDVKVGDTVNSGQVFARMGNTGHVSKRTGDGSHLHYRVKDKDGRDVDPTTHKFADWIGKGSAKEAPKHRGASTWSAAERLQIGQFDRQLTDKFEAEEEREKKEAQEKVQDAFVDRIYGIEGAGHYPTDAEIRDARAKGLLTPQMAAALLEHTERDRDEAHSDADHAAAHAKALAGDDSDYDGLPRGGQAGVMDLIGGVYAGRYKLNDARGEVLRRARNGYYGAGDERKKRVAKALTELNAIESARKKAVFEDPSFKTATGKIDQYAAQYAARLDGMPLSPAKRAAAKKKLAGMATSAKAGLAQAFVSRGDEATDVGGAAAARWFVERAEGMFK